MRSLALITLLLVTFIISACGTLGDKADETVGWSANKLYVEAKDALSEGSYDKAVRYFEKLEARYPYGRYAQQAQLDIAYAYWKSGEALSAISACNRFIKLHPNHPNVDYAYYLKGLVGFNEDLGILAAISGQDPTERDPRSAREAFDAFKELAVRYPKSKYTPDAIARMKYLVNALAYQEMHVARYYMKRGAYLAAVNRAQFALQNYPDAPAIEEALFIMVKAYDLMDMKELRDDAERIMRKNYPQSEYYVRGLNRNEPWWKLW